MPGCDAPITVVIASDSPLFAEGLSALLDAAQGIDVVGKVHSLELLAHLSADHIPDALIINARSVTVTAEAIVTAVRAIRHMYPNMGIVVISDRGHQFALDLLHGQSGAAFLADEHLICIESVVEAVKETVAGQNPLNEAVLDSFIRCDEARRMDELSPGQVEILQLMSRGLSNRAIADELHYSVKSIEKGITAIFLKLGPFGQGHSDRRVSAALMYLRARSDPSGSDHEAVPATMPVAFPDDSWPRGSPT